MGPRKHVGPDSTPRGAHAFAAGPAEEDKVRLGKGRESKVPGTRELHAHNGSHQPKGIIPAVSNDQRAGNRFREKHFDMPKPLF